jgi:hypothetical protein
MTNRAEQFVPPDNLALEQTRIPRGALPERMPNEAVMCVLWVAPWKPT